MDQSLLTSSPTIFKRAPRLSSQPAIGFPVSLPCLLSAFTTDAIPALECARLVRFPAGDASPAIRNLELWTLDSPTPATVTRRKPALLKDNTRVGNVIVQRTS